MGEDVKAYKAYAEQVAILAGRGMDMGDRDAAVETLRRVNYYRLSGYWYPFRKQTTSGREDDFYAGARFLPELWVRVRGHREARDARRARAPRRALRRVPGAPREWRESIESLHLCHSCLGSFHATIEERPSNKRWLRPISRGELHDHASSRPCHHRRPAGVLRRPAGDPVPAARRVPAEDHGGDRCRQ